eukprot:1157538-Pelagomonas_calceolata.AAC.2
MSIHEGASCPACSFLQSPVFRLLLLRKFARKHLQVFPLGQHLPVHLLLGPIVLRYRRPGRMDGRNPCSTSCTGSSALHTLILQCDT